MLFNSFSFLVFFPIVLLVYFIVPAKLRYLWLLVASYYFYMSWNPKYAILIAISTLITYASGRMLGAVSLSCMNSSKGNRARKLVVAASLISNLSILAVFKYANFALQNVNNLLSLLNIQVLEYSFDLLLPVGISFYTFQALSYTMDVYRGKIEPEKNLLKYALFVSFFPQLVAGPIERSGNLMKQVQNIATKNIYNMQAVHQGCLLMLWGFFQKLFIADRAAVYVTSIYENYQNYGLIELGAASVIFAIQIYCDFDGYTNIARGAAKIMGFDLMVNFKQPYFATNIKEFWRRWHVSLTTWFTDYLYIPLGGNRKGFARQMVNIFIVFLVSGLWHGASWHYMIWGCIHGIYQIVGALKSKYCKPPKEGVLQNALNMLITFVLVDFAWIFFRADSTMQALQILRQMATCFYGEGLIVAALGEIETAVLLLGILCLFVVDYLKNKEIPLYDILMKQCIVLRYAFYLIAVELVLLLGYYGSAYDASQFIYFQF